MEEDALQVEKSSGEFQQSYDHESQELVVPSHSPAESPSSSPTPQQLVVDSIKDSNQVNAITVLTLLDKLVNMLDSVQENQHKMEKRQIDIENSVKGIQTDITKMSKNHTSTSNTVSKLLEKSRKEENEIPANLFVKEPTPIPSITEGLEESTDHKNPEETMHTIDLSSDDEINPEDDAQDDSIDEKLEQTRAEKIKRSSLKKVDSLKKAFSRQNIEKKMNKISTKIVSPERREKIKKSFTQSQNKSSKSSSFKVAPLTFNVKTTQDGETPAENTDESTMEVVAEKAVDDHDKSSLSEKTSEVSFPHEEIKAIVDSMQKETKTEESQVVNNIELSIIEDEEEGENELEFESENPFSTDYKPMPEDTEESYEEPTHSTALQIDQSA
ncbi:hypothetical protein FKM82_015877 [Ascaphus truei]